MLCLFTLPLSIHQLYTNVKVKGAELTLSLPSHCLESRCNMGTSISTRENQHTCKLNLTSLFLITPSLGNRQSQMGFFLITLFIAINRFSNSIKIIHQVDLCGYECRRKAKVLFKTSISLLRRYWHWYGGKQVGVGCRGCVSCTGCKLNRLLA